MSRVTNVKPIIRFVCFFFYFALWLWMYFEEHNLLWIVGRDTYTFKKKSATVKNISYQIWSNRIDYIKNLHVIYKIFVGKQYRRWRTILWKNIELPVTRMKEPKRQQQQQQQRKHQQSSSWIYRSKYNGSSIWFTRTS